MEQLDSTDLTRRVEASERFEDSGPPRIQIVETGEDGQFVRLNGEDEGILHYVPVPTGALPEFTPDGTPKVPDPETQSS